MSLDWNATKVVGIDWDNKEEGDTVGRFAFILMFLGIGSVNEKNVAEVIVRNKIHEALFGATYYYTDETTGVRTNAYDADFIRRMIGYSTNVSTEPRAKWLKRMTDSAIQDQVRLTAIKAKREQELV